MKAAIYARKLTDDSNKPEDNRYPLRLLSSTAPESMGRNWRRAASMSATGCLPTPCGSPQSGSGHDNIRNKKGPAIFVDRFSFLASPRGIERYAGQCSTGIGLASTRGFELYTNRLSLPWAA